jgi:hypothetical protein
LYKVKKILVRLSQRYAIDLRALSLLRIGIALVVIADLCIRISDLTAHYTDAGMWPSELVYTFGWKPGFWCLHALSGTYAWALTLFAIHFFFAGCLLLGYRAKLATVVVWLLTISLHNRNGYILQAGDDLLRLVLFWGLFLPWNACYAIDAKQGRARAKQIPLANLGYFMLLASVYFFTVFLKTGSEWRSDHSAVYYALSLDQMRLPLTGDWLYAHYGLMTALTRIVFFIELLIPFLILWPSKKGQLRLLAFFLILILQAGIGITLYVGLFFIINIVSALGVLSKKSLDVLEAKFRVHTPVTRAKAKVTRFKYLRNGLCVCVIIFCLLINLSAFTWFDYELRAELNYGVNVLRLNQYWGMFSPGVLKKDGWFVLHGADSIGRQWDLRKNKDFVDYKKPLHIVSMYKNDRWRKLAENLQNDNCTFLRPLFCNYLLQHWNSVHPEKKMAHLNLYFMEKETLPNYKTTAVIKQLYCTCNDN